MNLELTMALNDPLFLALWQAGVVTLAAVSLYYIYLGYSSKSTRKRSITRIPFVNAPSGKYFQVGMRLPKLAQYIMPYQNGQYPGCMHVSQAGDKVVMRYVGKIRSPEEQYFGINVEFTPTGEKGNYHDLVSSWQPFPHLSELTLSQKFKMHLSEEIDGYRWMVLGFTGISGGWLSCSHPKPPLESCHKVMAIAQSRGFGDGPDDWRLEDNVCSAEDTRKYCLAYFGACMDGNLEVVSQLIHKDPLIMYYRDNDGWTGAHYAAYNGRSKVIKYLAKVCPYALTTEVDHEKNSPLHIAAYSITALKDGDQEAYQDKRSLLRVPYSKVIVVVNKLREAGASQTDRNIHNLTPGEIMDSEMFPAPAALRKLVASVRPKSFTTPGGSLTGHSWDAFVFLGHITVERFSKSCRNLFGYLAKVSNAIGILRRYIYHFLKAAPKAITARKEDRPRMLSKAVLGATLSIRDPAVVRLMEITGISSYFKDYFDDKDAQISKAVQTPLAEAQIWELLQEEFDGQAEELFHHVDPTPMSVGARGSIHRATLHNGHNVVLKLVYPRGVVAMKRAISACYVMFKLVAETKARRFNIISKMLTQGYDMRRTAYKLEAMEDLMADTSIKCPMVLRELCTDNVLVSAYISAVPVREARTPTSAEHHIFGQVNMGESVAIRLHRWVLKSILLDGVYVLGLDEDNLQVDAQGNIVILDVSSVGFISTQNRDYLSMFFLCVFTNNVYLAAEIYVRELIIGAERLTEDQQRHLILEAAKKFADWDDTFWNPYSLELLLEPYGCTGGADYLKYLMTLVRTADICKDIYPDMDITASRKKFVMESFGLLLEHTKDNKYAPALFTEGFMQNLLNIAMH
eukprot:GFYU01002557.1.p1 GENE.GFYU01002557.1~~GFYU01002557.1.p1  ORF type:complete len:855 (-),score=183.64 GFYU01002557.1:168-2732(-)